jgi:hypothetical protein
MGRSIVDHPEYPAIALRDPSQRVRQRRIPPVHFDAVRIGCTTLTGKPWSAKLTPSADTLRKLREKHGGELESWWEDTFGYGFGFLTESEARYLARADSVELIRNRILAARQAHDD